MDRILCHFTQGHNVHSALGKFAPEFEDYPVKTIRKVTRDGSHFELDISDYQEWLIYYGFTNDKPEGLFELIKPHYNILDIGANIGQTSIAFAKHINSSSKIWAFEPEPLNYKKCLTNINLNTIQNIELIQAGLGSYEHEAYMDPQMSRNRGGSHVQETKGNGHSIRIITLDTFVRERKIKVDLVKMDVEGYEYEVLKGAREFLSDQHPILFIEVDEQHLKKQNSTPAMIMDYLNELHYTVYHATNHVVVTKAYDFSNCHFDVFAIHAKTT
ncbi:MAG: FkbM family methyltransferase [Bacteroidetes bacterium]|nr:FkbM family methyltransferase [Bacteroidota bacterium]